MHSWAATAFGGGKALTKQAGVQNEGVASPQVEKKEKKANRAAVAPES